jgi:hypothetical protein
MQAPQGPGDNLNADNFPDGVIGTSSTHLESFKPQSRAVPAGASRSHSALASTALHKSDAATDTHDPHGPRQSLLQVLLGPLSTEPVPAAEYISLTQ